MRKLGNSKYLSAFLLPSVVFGVLTGCGGSDQPSPAAPPANRAPSFTSTTTATIAENSTAPVYQATATDPDGDALTFTISGGADAARFAITPAGQLTFIDPPNFDLATDADDNNVYEVQLSVGDGKTTTALSLAVTVTNLKEGVAVRRIATGFVDPVAIAPVSGTVVLVAEKSGAIYTLNPTTGAKVLLYQIAGVGGVGVTALAVDPAYATTGTFYAMYTTSGGGLVVHRFLGNPGGPHVPDNFGPILGLSAPQYAGGGWLGFGGTNDLFAAIGDGGGIADPTDSAQNPSSYLGKLIRISPNPDPYAGAAPSFFILRIIASGLHAPNGGAAQLDGSVIIADRGQALADEINFHVQDVPSTPASNFGWPFKEGNQTLRGTPPAGLISPTLELARGTGKRSSQGIVGGTVGLNSVASLRSQYIFGDRSGAIFVVPVSRFLTPGTRPSSIIERRDQDFVPNVGTINAIVAIVADGGDARYILDGDGEVFSIEAG